MSLARARCQNCSEPLADPPHVPVPMPCSFCGKQAQLAFAADGQLVDFDASYAPQKLLAWFSAARRAMATGTPGVAVGSCTHCAMPMVISSKTPVTLPCPHCKVPVQGPAETVLVDQWIEPWCKVDGSGLDVEYRLAWVDDSTGITAGCAHCGAPTPSDDPSQRCRRCGAVAWVQRDGKRMQLGVRINGTRGDRPYNALMSLAHGETALRSDTATGSASSSGSSILNMTGIGCAAAFAITLLLSILIAIIAHYSK
jgi:hypothetical protein